MEKIIIKSERQHLYWKIECTKKIIDMKNVRKRNYLCMKTSKLHYFIDSVGCSLLVIAVIVIHIILVLYTQALLSYFLQFWIQIFENVIFGEKIYERLFEKFSFFFVVELFQENVHNFRFVAL